MVAGKDNDLLSILRQDRKPSMEARLLSWLPNIPSIRNLTLKLVFLAMKWKDILS
jgi:hypothetical protein